MEGGQLAPPYKVVLHKKARKGLQSLTGNRRAEAETFLNDFLPFTPLRRVPGKTKKLRGAYEKAGYLQYDLPDGCRAQYRVDDEVRVVYVDYLDHHP
jgi:mRNA-degrading endonuclease RelE of RelBE toxin-antitoxin system